MKASKEIDFIHSACDLTYVAQLFRRTASLDPILHGFDVQSAIVFRHKVGKRCLIKYCGLDSQGAPFECLGKIRFKGLDERTPKLQGELREAGFDGTRGYTVPRVLGMVPALNMWLQEYIYREKPLSIGSPDFISLQIPTAEALARLHQSTISSQKCHLLEDELKLLDDRFQQLEQSHSELSPAIDRLQTEIRQISRQFNWNGRITTIHRDFYFDQVLISPQQTVLLDFDLSCLGPPELDVGNYIGHLREYSLRYPEYQLACHTAEVAFQDAYFNKSPRASRLAVEYWANLTLARHVFLSTVLPGRCHTTNELPKLVLSGLSNLRQLAPNTY